MTLGGVDDTKYTGDFNYVTAEKLEGKEYAYWLVYGQSIKIDGEDTGACLVRFRLLCCVCCVLCLVTMAIHIQHNTSGFSFSFSFSF